MIVSEEQDLAPVVGQLFQPVAQVLQFLVDLLTAAYRNSIRFDKIERLTPAPCAAHASDVWLCIIVNNHARRLLPGAKRC